MKLIDISMPLSSETPHWPTDEAPSFTKTSEIEHGKQSNDTKLAMSLHTGTHYDAPLHFLSGGKTIDQLPLSIFAGPAFVVCLPGVKKVTAQDLQQAGIPEGTERILFKTDNSERWGSASQFSKDYVGLSLDAAEWLAHREIVLVGIDYLSVAAYDEIAPVHRAFLAKNVAILEGLDLRKAEQGAYELIAYPLSMLGVEAAPTRALLMDFDK